jgi:hypothetical protein
MTESKTFVIHGGVSKYHSCVPVAFYAVAGAGNCASCRTGLNLSAKYAHGVFGLVEDILLSA